MSSCLSPAHYLLSLYTCNKPIKSLSRMVHWLCLCTLAPWRALDKHLLWHKGRAAPVSTQYRGEKNLTRNMRKHAARSKLPFVVAWFDRVHYSWNKISPWFSHLVVLYMCFEMLYVRKWDAMTVLKYATSRPCSAFMGHRHAVNELHTEKKKNQFLLKLLSQSTQRAYNKHTVKSYGGTAWCQQRLCARNPFSTNTNKGIF